MMSSQTHTKEYFNFDWTTLPDSITLTIFSFLGHKSLSQASLVCCSWLRLAFDEILWKELFCRHWGISRSVPISPGKQSWVQEYKRLLYHTPCIESEVIKEHSDEVWHVSFSHNGEMFATTSKDSSVKVWNVGNSVKLKFEADMKIYNFEYTNFSQFNNSDSLLLVSGPKTGVLSTNLLGLIVVFSVDGDFIPLQTLRTTPFDTFGGWYNDHFILHGNRQHLAHLEYSSEVCLSKVCPKFMSENEPMTTRLFKIKNLNASFVGNLMVAYCSKQNDFDSKKTDTEKDLECQSNNILAMKSMKFKERDTETEESEYNRCKEISKQGNTPHKDVVENAKETSHVSSKLTSMEEMGNSEPNNHGMEKERLTPKRNDEDEHSRISVQFAEINIQCSNENKQGIALNIMGRDSCYVESEVLEEESNQMLMNNQNKQVQEQIRAAPNSFQSFNRRDHIKQETQNRTGNGTTDSETAFDYIIFTTGSKAESPHQIGIKKVIPFPDGIVEINAGINVTGNANNYDEIDHLFEMEGHVTGMCVSPDQRYLYLNCRAWPENYHIADPFEPPSISNDIDMHVIDLQQMRDLGVIHRGHKAYTLSETCFYTYLDVADDYVGSGAEDKQGYLWDRHYGICVQTFPHDDIVNSVAFNPIDPEVLVTVSDDWSIKVWRSLNRQNQVMDSESKPY